LLPIEGIRLCHPRRIFSVHSFIHSFIHSLSTFLQTVR